MKKSSKQLLFERMHTIGGMPLKEYSNKDIFLSTYDTAEKYALQNIDDVKDTFEEYKQNPEDIQVSYMYDQYVDRIQEYVDKYNELKNLSSVRIYRQVNLISINDLDINNIGMHWSFEKEGVGAYGEQHPNRGMMNKGKPFILEGTTTPNNIDWIYGFHSFIWYGDEQWEAALEKGSTVVIDKINNELLKQPIKAIVGDH